MSKVCTGNRKIVRLQSGQEGGECPFSAHSLQLIWLECPVYGACACAVNHRPAGSGCREHVRVVVVV